jgi:hypothetical protein
MAVGGNSESGAWYDCPLYVEKTDWTDEAFAAHFPCPQFGPAGSCHPGPPYSGESWCETHDKMLTDCIRDKVSEIARLKAALAEAHLTRPP